MTQQDITVSALCAWRENRSGGAAGMTSVINVLVNRAKSRDTSVYDEALRPEQFSSMTTAGNPELGTGPNALNTADWNAFLTALSLASQAAQDLLPDITGEATLYYAPTGIGPSTKTFAIPGGNIVPFPEGWDESAVQFTTEVHGQLFFKEVR